MGCEFISYINKINIRNSQPILPFLPLVLFWKTWTTSLSFSTGEEVVLSFPHRSLMVREMKPLAVWKTHFSHHSWPVGEDNKPGDGLEKIEKTRIIFYFVFTARLFDLFTVTRGMDVSITWLSLSNSLSSTTGSFSLICRALDCWTWNSRCKRQTSPCRAAVEKEEKRF